MLKPNPKSPYKSSRQASTGSSMDSKQLIDSLTAHISLYHSSSGSPSPSSGNPNPRSSILKWFSSLTVPQRQAHLTVVDQKFVQVILQMQGKLRSNAHGVFIILPDIPSSGGLGLPSLCYRRSHGLLARVSESNESERLIYDSVRLFNSREGERLEECSCSASCLDSLTVCEGFVENVDRFVAAMDGVSCGAFLSGEEGGLGSEWIELEWLKAKGYYSIEAFVANRLEVALRLSWLNCNSGKKRGVKLKEKITLAGVAANVFWRKKGCMDWWTKLETATKRNIFRVILGKTAKPLVLFGFLCICNNLVFVCFMEHLKICRTCDLKQISRVLRREVELLPTKKSLNLKQEYWSVWSHSKKIQNSTKHYKHELREKTLLIA